MASTTVKIKYVGVAGEMLRKGAPIARTLTLSGSYVDEPVMTQGYKNDGSTGDKKSYGKSIYATNDISDLGLAGVLPMAHTTSKFAMFEQAIESHVAKGNEDTGVTFQVEGYEDVLYWEQMCANMVDNGFYSEVGSAKFGKDNA